jgi:hypothetical protein
MKARNVMLCIPFDRILEQRRPQEVELDIHDE